MVEYLLMASSPTSTSVILQIIPTISVKSKASPCWDSQHYRHNTFLMAGDGSWCSISL